MKVFLLNVLLALLSAFLVILLPFYWLAQYIMDAGDKVVIKLNKTEYKQALEKVERLEKSAGIKEEDSL